ncbi:hypothetical protein [Thermococcus zilligii]|uniref:hypothetical protein n=1 Tax=Thermococcus zilligii TaxID=54076 RepID=UPI00029AC8B5|nr:hypothetical protein [Thermococcus zilligii]
MNVISWHFDVEYLRKNLENGGLTRLLLRNRDPLRLPALLGLFRLPPGRYSLKILGEEVLADDSNEPIFFISVPQDSFLVGIYLAGALEKFNREIATKDWFVEYLRKYFYPPEIRRIPDPRLKETPIEELQKEYLLKCPGIEEPVFDATFGKVLNPVVFKLKGENVLVCSEIYLASEDGTRNPKRIMMECEAGPLSKAFLRMGEESLKDFAGLVESLPDGPWKEPLSAYIEVLEVFKEFSRRI